MRRYTVYYHLRYLNKWMVWANAPMAQLMMFTTRTWEASESFMLIPNEPGNWKCED